MPFRLRFVSLRRKRDEPPSFLNFQKLLKLMRYLLLIQTTELNRTVSSMQRFTRRFKETYPDYVVDVKFVSNSHGFNWEVRADRVEDLFFFTYKVGIQGIAVIRFSYNFNRF